MAARVGSTERFGGAAGGFAGGGARLTAFAFDVGETLVDETGMWERAADACGVPRFTLMGVLGGLAARGEQHGRVWEILGVERPHSTWTEDDFYPDALPCLEALRAAGRVVMAVGNTPAFVEDGLRGLVDHVGSSERWGVEKPSREFFARVVSELDRPAGEIAYVGDRVDNDVEPALAAGLTAIHIRRGPWGHLQETPAGVRRIDSLLELCARRRDGARPGAEPPARPVVERE
ncbi:MAG TPA: HAD family hydrolase [Gaiellaceae bacterium]|nr:HAD family hydrolase [Gaiellaceae bacterium]